jgi:hypothetical protein
MLAWFVENALKDSGVSSEMWEKMSRNDKETLLRAWQKHIGSKINFAALAHIKDAPIEQNEKPYIVISWQTAEYFSCLSGQIPWGNQRRRGNACAELGEAMHGQISTSSIECFQDATWDIITKKK